jgi:Holliday junction resolvase RusA-like endonuclease
VRYPRGYARDRDAWALVVAHAVAGQRWRPPPIARYRVQVAVYGGGKRDLDRVCTAVLDALQGGKAIRDDVFVTSLTATKTPAAGVRARTEVRLEVCHG